MGRTLSAPWATHMTSRMCYRSQERDEAWKMARNMTNETLYDMVNTERSRQFAATVVLSRPTTHGGDTQWVALS